MKYGQTFKQTYDGKKVFITGHTGFKGSWMLSWLHKLGATIKGYALAPEGPNDHYNLIKGDKLCQSVIADIRDRDRLEKELISFKPDFVFHLAAQPIVRRSYLEPLYTFEVNVQGTANLLDAVRNLDNPCSVIVITTDKVYENIEQHYAYCEEDKLGGYDPYSASKAAAEIIVSSYRNSFFNPEKYSTHKKGIASARAGNVIGGGDRAHDRIIPDIVRGIESEEPIIVRNPESIRPWQHVLEPISGYLRLGQMLAEKPEKFSAAWNLGPSPLDVLLVRQVVEKAISVFGRGSYSTPNQGNQPHEAKLLQLDIAKAKNQLGWEPKLDSAQAIEWTIKWYKKDADSAANYTLDQIAEYEEL